MLDSNAITFISEGVSFELDYPKSIVKWIQQTISREERFVGEIAYIFCSDEYLHKLNVKHLNHDTFTDIITFNYCVENLVSADIFISIDRVRENAETFQTSFQDELNRVIIHGILHLVGYDDRSDADKKTMRSKEDFYLSLLSN